MYMQSNTYNCLSRICTNVDPRQRAVRVQINEIATALSTVQKSTVHFTFTLEQAESVQVCAANVHNYVSPKNTSYLTNFIIFILFVLSAMTLLFYLNSYHQGTYTLGRFLAHAAILCTVMGADKNKESFPYPGVGSTCLCYCFSQKSAYTFRVNEIRLWAGDHKGLCLHLHKT